MISQATLRSQFQERYQFLVGPGHPPRYRELVHEHWTHIKQLAQGTEVNCVPSIVEIHPTERCQLDCAFCRRELRIVPEAEVTMPRLDLLALVDSIHVLSPRCLVRFSGLIGEPLIHSGMVDAFEKLNAHSMAWGLTTNGLLLHRQGVSESLLGARFVYVGIDAGSDATYFALKGGRTGDFERVIANLDRLAELKKGSGSPLQIIVSFLLQSENFREISQLSERLRAVGVNAFEIKMQHFDERRGMDPIQISEAYEIIDAVQKRDHGETFRVLKVQSQHEALMKISKSATFVDFSSCYVNRLGLNATVDPRGNVQTCCQYYLPTLGAQGHVSEGFETVWNGPGRAAVLRIDPRQHCETCSPFDQFLNRFVHSLRQSQEQDPEFLAWVEGTFLS